MSLQTRILAAHPVTLSFSCLDTHRFLLCSENKEGISGPPEAEMGGVSTSQGTMAITRSQSPRALEPGGREGDSANDTSFNGDRIKFCFLSHQVCGSLASGNKWKHVS